MIKQLAFLNGYMNKKATVFSMDPVDTDDQDVPIVPDGQAQAPLNTDTNFKEEEPIQGTPSSELRNP